MESFLVQVWIPVDDVSSDGRLHGRVRHVTSGVVTPFRSDAEVLDLLRRARTDSVDENGEHDHDQ